jgi:hypothetical protein
MGKSRDDHLRDAERHARSAERWATASMWGAGCGLLVWVLPVLAAIAIAVWIFLATR